jgi:hypothetical protein
MTSTTPDPVVENAANFFQGSSGGLFARGFGSLGGQGQSVADSATDPRACFFETARRGARGPVRGNIPPGGACRAASNRHPLESYPGPQAGSWPCLGAWGAGRPIPRPRLSRPPWSSWSKLTISRGPPPRRSHPRRNRRQKFPTAPRNYCPLRGPFSWTFLRALVLV